MPLAPPPRNVLGLIGAFVLMSMVGGVLAAGLVVPAAGATGMLTKSSVTFFDSLPSELAQPPQAETTRVLAADGSLIATFYDENRRNRELKDISPFMQDAIVAIEDSRFFEHGGIDTTGLARAAIVNQISGRSAQGASTLTQQYVKNVRLEAAKAAGDQEAAKLAAQKSAGRKLSEIRLAVSLEQQLTKPEILNRYLNVVWFGKSIYGVEAASKYYFRTTAKKLTLAQAATLAGMVQDQVKYSPRFNPKASLVRRNVVLDRMLQLNKIDQKAHDDAVATKLVVKLTNTPNGCANALHQYGYYCDYVHRLILGSKAFSALGNTPDERENTLLRGGLTIKTAMSPRVMKAAWKALSSTIPPKDKSNVATATVTVEAGTGNVLSIQQNKTYSPSGRRGEGSQNYAVDKEWGGSSGFPTGSTFKAYTLATWLAAGKSLNAVLPSSGGTTSYNAFTRCGSALGSGTYTYANANEGRTSDATMSVWDGTAGSVNGVYISMEKQLDLCKIRETAEKIGVHLAAPRPVECGGTGNTRRLPTCIPSVTLGVASISPMTMAGAYAAFAADGEFCKPTAVLSIKDRTGKALKVPGANCKQALDKDVASGVNLGLSRVLTNGTARSVGVLANGRPASGKTGTTNDSVDTWFVGYTRQLSTAVWVGDPDVRTGSATRSSLNRRTIGGQYRANVFGATLAGPIWKQIMTTASRGMQIEQFDAPSAQYLAAPKQAVPDVRGKSPEEAQAILVAAGFQATINPTQEQSTFPQGSVASTSPGGGTSASAGTAITLNLSAGGGDPGNGDGVVVPGGAGAG